MQASTSAARERAFKEAVQLRQALQPSVADAIQQHRASETAQWKEATDDIDRMIAEAGNLKKRSRQNAYELIGRQLHAANPGSGDDKFEERRILAFTQRMRDDPALRDKLSQWFTDAAGPLNSYGVGGTEALHGHPQRFYRRPARTTFAT